MRETQKLLQEWIIHAEWIAGKKNKSWKSIKQQQIEKDFAEDMKNLFDVAHADALTLINIQEDQDFREPGCQGTIGSVDQVQSRLEACTAKRQLTFGKRQLLLF